MWREVKRFRVRDEGGTIHVVVEMSNLADATTSSLRPATDMSFFFTLDGSDLTAIANGAFVHQKTGKLLTLVHEDSSSR